MFFCRLCKKNRRLEYGLNSSCVNIFRVSERKDAPAKDIASYLRKMGIEVDKSLSQSQVLCMPCGRKMWKLAELFDIAVSSFQSHSSFESQSEKRKSSNVLTPGKSPRAKSVRKDSPVSKKRLDYSKSVEDVMLSKLNIDDLNFDDNPPTSHIKVLIAYPSGNITVNSNFDNESKCIIANICLSNWRTVANSICRHRKLYFEFLKTLQNEANKEFANFSKSDSCLKITSPDQLSTFSNRTLWHEVSVYCPVYAAVVQGACNMASKEEAINAAALATSSLVRVRNPQMSAVAYRISTILAHSGVGFHDFTRLNHLGVCMSHKSTVALQEKMGENHDFKVKRWKKIIEGNKSALLLVNEIKQKQVPPKEENDMDVEVSLDLNEESLKSYQWYHPRVFNEVMDLLRSQKQRMNEDTLNDDVLEAVLEQLKETKLPMYK